MEGSNERLGRAHTTYMHTLLAGTHYRATWKLTAKEVSFVLREKKKTTRILIKIGQSLVPGIIALKRVFLLL